ncbi:hypothetical protein [Mycolicibacterium llatzerense]|uniref:hypothetical protein n=1 Tax=Mycolicibacterium llatzerense TaxID=280871 RepID=UPI0013A6A9F7|nr:hypothetical protein [Mycolicibacterium llatzerense]
MATPLSWVSQYCTSEVLTVTTPPTPESMDHSGSQFDGSTTFAVICPVSPMVPDRTVLPSEATSPRRFRSVH